MISDRYASCVATSIAVLAATGCDNRVHDLSVASEPLLVVRGHVDLTSLERQHPEVPLIGALVWAGVPQISPVCLKPEFSDGTNPDAAKIRPACPDPYGVFYGEIERAAPVDENGNFSLSLFVLPKASVSVGDAVTRIAYGSLLVAEDLTGDGQLSLPRGRRFREDPSFMADPPVEPDAIVAASFHSLRADQQRVVFREGGFVKDSNFYPAPGCDPPPPGFSILGAPPYSDAPAPAGNCTSRAATATIAITALTPEQGASLGCRVAQRTSRVEQLDNQPDKRIEPVCLSHEIMAYVIAGTCPQLGVYALKGCDRDPFCLAPEWDATAAPPAWWPCP